MTIHLEHIWRSMRILHFAAHIKWSDQIGKIYYISRRFDAVSSMFLLHFTMIIIINNHIGKIYYKHVLSFYRIRSLIRHSANFQRFPYNGLRGLLAFSINFQSMMGRQAQKNSATLWVERHKSWKNTMPPTCIVTFPI